MPIASAPIAGLPIAGTPTLGGNAGYAIAPNATASGYGFTATTGTGHATTLDATAYGTGTGWGNGIGYAIAPNATAAGTGAGTVWGIGNAITPDATAAGTGKGTVYGYGRATTPDATALGYGFVTAWGAGNATTSGATAAGAGRGAVTDTGVGYAFTPDATATGNGAGYEPYQGVSSVQSIEDIINLALVRIGYARRISSIWEGSEASVAALTIYAQTRDELLRSFDYDFAERNATLTPIKQAPPGGYVPPIVWSDEYPPLPWRCEIAYPADALKIRAVKNVPLFDTDFAPQAYQFAVANDGGKKVILCNVMTGVIVYTGQVTTPSDMVPDFVEALAASLGERLAPVLVGFDAEKAALLDAQQSGAVAEDVEG